jgi:sigma-54 dependent transcriptional regulator, acetoin dehydrogenase operon transcriptional activator AcoR
VDVRVLSATNRDLKREVDRKRFREDLYYRLNVVPLKLPPLRERQSDLPLLVAYFLERARARGQQVPRFDAAALALMQHYPWPGNVRELQNAVHYAVAGCRGEVAGPADLPPEIRKATPPRGPAPKLNAAAVAAALRQCGGNKAKAARLLGVGRATLYRFLVSQETSLSHEDR